MGVLVVMLVLAVKATQMQVADDEEDQQQEQQEIQQQLQDALDLAQIQQHGWLSIRPDLLQKLQTSRAKRSYLQDALRELDDEARIVAEQLRQLERQELSPELDETAQRDLSQLRGELSRQIADLQADIERAKQQTHVQPTLYSIVPSASRNGTHRQPIYVECNRHGVVLQPYGIVLQPSDFVQPIGPGNPLDAALTCIREHYARLSAREEGMEPYPLLVVRPSGAQTFGLARRAMVSWVDEFGYELIDEQMSLDFGEADQRLQDEIRAVVEQAKQIQLTRAKLQHAAADQLAQIKSAVGEVSLPGLKVDRVNGGFVRVGSNSKPHRFSDSWGRTGAQDQGDSSPASPANQRPFNRNAASENSGSATSPDTRESSIAPRQHSTAPSLPNQFNAENDGQASALTSSTVAMPLSQSRGANWALPNRAPQGTAYVRPILVICTEHELLVDPGSNSSTDRLAIQLTTETMASTDSLVRAVWTVTESWGPAPQDGYWKPELRCRALPGGERRFHDLTVLLLNSGFTIGEEQR